MRKFNVPLGWQLVRLGDCLVRRPDYGINAPAVTYSSDLPVYLRITDISDDGKLRRETRVSVDQRQASDYVLEHGDIVFARTGASVGKTYLYDHHDGELVFAGFLIRAKCDNEKLLPSFLSMVTHTKAYWDWVKETSMRSGQPGINSTEYAEFKFSLPPIPEQVSVVSVIETWNQMIQKLSQKIEKKKNVKKGLMQKLLTGKTRLPGFTEAWTHTTIGEVSKILSGFPFSSENFSEEHGVRVVRNRDLKGDSQILYYTGKNIPDSYTVRDGDILIGMDGDFMACRWSKGRALLNQRVGRLVASKDTNEDFLFYTIQIPLKIIEQETSSTTVKHLSAKVLEDFKLLLPQKPEQDAIANILVTTDREIEILERQLKEVLVQRRYLLNNLVTGKIRLSEMATVNHE